MKYVHEVTAIIPHTYELNINTKSAATAYVHYYFFQRMETIISNLLFQPFMLMKKRKPTKIWASKGNFYTWH